MYNEELTIAVLARLHKEFPTFVHSKSLYDLLQSQFPQITENELLNSLDALLRTGMIEGVPLRDGSTLADLSISARGREELQKQEIVSRQGFLQRLYDIVDGREGPTISPMQFLQVGSQLGLSEDAVNQMIRQFLSDGVIKRKPSSEVVAFTLKGVNEVERQMGLNGRKVAVHQPTPPVSSSGTDDWRFARLAIEEARKSVPEDGRVHPKVGVVVVKEGRVLASAHRGEFPQSHAEFIALEKKLPDQSLSAATVYTTLEPCTSRNHPKVPCATRLAERKVARVVIGMLDPDDRISGRGQRLLRKAGIVTELFPPDLMAEVEELNRDFMRDRESHETPSHGAHEGKGLSAFASALAAPKVRVGLKRGHVSNFLIEYTNDEDEPIFVREARLFGGKDGRIELTEPLTPDNPSTWRVAAHCSATFGKTIVHQRDPAASLVRMNSNAGIFFETEMVLVASCEMKSQLFEVRQTLYVKVNATKPEIVPLV